MITLKNVDATNADLQQLIFLLDKELQQRDGNEHEFYHQFNGLADVKYMLVAYENNKAVGCGAIKEYDSTTMEIKRMFVHEEYRSKGIATIILLELEKQAAALGYQYTILETGIKQPEAIRLYEKNGYNKIANFGQYVGVVNSVCYYKKLN